MYDDIVVGAELYKFIDDIDLTWKNTKTFISRECSSQIICDNEVYHIIGLGRMLYGPVGRMPHANYKIVNQPHFKSCFGVMVDHTMYSIISTQGCYDKIDDLVFTSLTKMECAEMRVKLFPRKDIPISEFHAREFLLDKDDYTGNCSMGYEGWFLYGHNQIDYTYSLDIDNDGYLKFSAKFIPKYKCENTLKLKLDIHGSTILYPDHPLYNLAKSPAITVNFASKTPETIVIC